MKNSIFDYLDKYGNKSWDERPMSNEDLAVFSQIVFAPFEEIEDDTYKGRTLSELNKLVFKDRKPFGSWEWAKSVLKLWEVLPQYSRFASARLDNFRANFQPKIDEQFAAATFAYGRTGIVVFRGTDMSIVGWKEDFDMGYRTPLPCQIEAVKYLNAELSQYEKVYVVGQSKGGHLALYASACAEDKSRIIKILSLEGPGIDKKTYNDHWSEIKDKTEILLPQTAIIGMTVGYGGNFSVVKSEAVGLLQHDPFTWVIEDDHFKSAELSHLSMHLYTVLHDFIEETSPEERGVLIETFFNMVDSVGVDDVESLGKEIIPNIRKPLKVLSEVDDDEKAIINKLRYTIRDDIIESARLLLDMNLFKTSQELKVKKGKIVKKFFTKKQVSTS